MPPRAATVRRRRNAARDGKGEEEPRPAADVEEGERFAVVRAQHVLDEPERWGVDPSTRKEEGGTLTTWVACERDPVTL